MTFHAFAEYLKYRWKAKGRHGTHSPFAYDFVESVLRDKKPIEKSGFEFPDEHLQKQWGVLVDRTMRYYGLKKLKLLRHDEGEYLNADALLLLDDEPGEWRAIAEKYFRMVRMTPWCLSQTSIRPRGTPKHGTSFAVGGRCG